MNPLVIYKNFGSDSVLSFRIEFGLVLQVRIFCPALTQSVTNCTLHYKFIVMFIQFLSQIFYRITKRRITQYMDSISCVYLIDYPHMLFLTWHIIHIFFDDPGIQMLSKEIRVAPNDRPPEYTWRASRRSRGTAFFTPCSHTRGKSIPGLDQ